MLSLCRFWNISPLQLEEHPSWLIEEMEAYAHRQQAEEARQARRARG